jgi:hypothetical protein
MRFPPYPDRWPERRFKVCQRHIAQRRVQPLAALTACGWVPPFAGVFADRYDRRAMLLAMNAMGGGSLVGTFLLAGFARRVAP